MVAQETVAYGQVILSDSLPADHISPKIDGEFYPFWNAMLRADRWRFPRVLIMVIKSSIPACQGLGFLGTV